MPIKLPGTPTPTQTALEIRDGGAHFYVNYVLCGPSEGSYSPSPLEQNGLFVLGPHWPPPYVHMNTYTHAPSPTSGRRVPGLSLSLPGLSLSLPLPRDCWHGIPHNNANCFGSSAWESHRLKLHCVCSVIIVTRLRAVDAGFLLHYESAVWSCSGGLTCRLNFSSDFQNSLLGGSLSCPVL